MKNNSIFLIVIAMVLALALPVSCQSQKATTISSQEASIESYIKSSHSEREVHRINGVNRIVMVSGETDSLQVGDKATLFLKGYTFTSSPSTQFCEDTVSAVIGSGYLVSGLDNGLRGAHLKEECYIVFNAKYGFYDKQVGIVPSMSALLYMVTVINIEKAE